MGQGKSIDDEEKNRTEPGQDVWYLLEYLTSGRGLQSASYARPIRKLIDGEKTVFGKAVN
jgi:hypothetical protein